MTKLEKLIKNFDDVQAAKSELEQDVAQLEALKAAAAEGAENAAGAGNVDQYKKNRDEVQALTDTLFVRRKQLEKLSVMASEADAKEAWKEYAEGYNKGQAKAWAAYEKARRDLFAAFIDMTNAQNEALRMRKKCAECAGIPEGGGFMQPSGYDKILPLQMIPDEEIMPRQPIPVYTKAPDVLFFLNAKICDPDKIEMLNRVVHFHQPV